MPTPSVLSAISKIYSLLNRKEKIKWVGIFCFSLCVSALEMLTASVIVVLIQVINQPESGQKYLHKLGINENMPPTRIVFLMAITVGIVYLVKSIVVAGEAFYQNFSIQKMGYHFRNRMLFKYAEIDYGTYLTRNSSLGLQVVSGDTNQMFASGMLPISIVLSEGMVFACLIGMATYMDPSIAVTVFAVIISFGIIITKWVFPRFYRFGQKLQEFSLYSSQNLTQFFHAFKEVILLNKRESFIKAYSFFSKKSANVLAAQNAINLLPRIIIEILFMGTFVITISLLCRSHKNPTQVIGILGGYLYIGFRLMPGLNRVIGQLNIFKMSVPSIERLFNECIFLASKENYCNVPDFEFQEKIVIKDLFFHYLNTKKDALSGVFLEIRKGERVGIVGETGSGKSTLVDVILGLLCPCNGSVLIDGKYPVNSYQWHQRIGYVPQSVYLTDDTIEANIAFGEKDVNSKSLNQAIDAAQLRKFIDRLPQGAKTIVGERGIRLSGGERQRISIARALYRNPEVLIFDEATSALDNETESKLMETINTVSQSRTVIMIAHRLTTLKDCDRIVVMSDGKVEKISKYKDLFQGK